MITLDYQQGIVLDPDKPPIENCHAFDYNRVGLRALAETVRREEIAIAPLLPPGNTILMFHSAIPPILPCAFNWFSLTLVSYLRLIALIELMTRNGWGSADIAKRTNAEAIAKHCTSYVSAAVPDLYHWRNKIAAHFAATAPFKDDSMAVVEQSIMDPISYQTPYFYAGGTRWGSGGSESEFPKWALTKTYEDLALRYWPGERLEPLVSRP